MQVPTVKIVAPESDCGWKLINASDFVEGQDEVFDEQAKKVVKTEDTKPTTKTEDTKSVVKKKGA